MACFAEAPTVSAAAVGRAFSGLSAGELGELSQGRAVLRSGANPRSLAIVGENEAAREIRKRFTGLGPNYFAEFMYVVPSTSGYLDSLQGLLADPRKFVGMRYYSKRQATEYSLFDRMALEGNETVAGGGTRTLVRQHMEPFDEYRAAYLSRRIDRTLFFSFENEGPIVYSYQKIKAVGTRDMAWMLYAYESDGCLFLYGAGGVKAFDLFGVFRSRLEASFMGRIEAFFTYAVGALGAPKT